LDFEQNGFDGWRPRKITNEMTVDQPPFVPLTILDRISHDAQIRTSLQGSSKRHAELATFVRWIHAFFHRRPIQ
jgi:hypothetical protein